jgi:hypothetical protein
MTLSFGSVNDMRIDSNRVAKFYATNWERAISLTEERFYNWQFKSLPLSIGNDNCVIAYDSDKGVIAGVMGLNDRPFYLGGQQRHGAELTTWVVSDSYRNVGAGPKMLSHIQDNHDVLIGMGISAMALPVYLRSGFRYLGAIPRFVRVYDFDAVARVAKCDPLAKKLARQWLGGFPQTPYRTSEFAADDADALFARLTREFNLFARDAKHLAWRYANHPTFNYRIFFVRPEAAQGVAFVALRKETAIPDLSIYHVTDCIGDDSAMEAAFSCVDDLCLREGVHVADFFCTSTKVNRYPLSRGWFSTLDDRYFAFPHLFHPLEVRTPPTTSLVYWAKRDFAEMCDFSRLYISKQDADLDRPTLEQAST